MKNFFGIISLSVAMTFTLSAQSTATQTNPETQNTGQTSSAPTGSTVGAPKATGQPQMWTGVLMDANCQAISSMKPAIRSSSTSMNASSTTSNGTTHREMSPEVSRSRSKSSTSNSTKTSSADPYPACQVTSSTSSFALSSGGKVYFFDAASNGRIRQQLQTDSAFSNSTNSVTTVPLAVIVMGNPNGPEITMTTLQRSDK